MELSLPKEALRLVLNMPKWMPGMHNSRQVRVRCEVPFAFRIK